MRPGRTRRPGRRLARAIGIAGLAAGTAVAAAWVHSYAAMSVVERKWGRLQPPPGVAPVPLPAPGEGDPPPPAPLVRGQPVWAFHARTATLTSRRGVLSLSWVDAVSLAASPQDLSRWTGYGGWTAALAPARPPRQHTPRWFFDGPVQWRAGGLGCYETGVGGATARVVQAPHGLVLAVAILPAVIGWVRRGRWARRRARGRCPRCGYTRAGLDAGAPCPECGQRADAGGAPQPP